MKPTILACAFGFAVLASLTSLAGCAKDGPPASTTPVGDPATGAGDGDGTTPGAGGGPACASDADCVVSCAREGQCCDQLCPPCDQVFHREQLAALEQWRAETCAAESCPMAKCMAPTEDSIARCQAGACVIERVPLTAP